MASIQADLGRLLTDSYLRGMESKSLDDIRSMRAECQEAEVALSYLRRLAQGRLDIVQAYLVRPAGSVDDAGALPPSPRISPRWSRGCRPSWPRARGARRVPVT